MGINDQRVALMTSVNIFLKSNDFHSLSMKDRWLFILTDARYYEITEWEPFGGHSCLWHSQDDEDIGKL